MKQRKRKKLSAVQWLAYGFAFLILAGGILLSLPVATRSGEGTPILDAVFTAASAICVTGLTTLNTLTHWSFTGQLIILILIEIGGLGFMMLPVIFYALGKRKVSLSTRMVVKEALNLEHMSGTVALMLYVIKLAFVIQLIGAIALLFVFVPEFGVLKGSWYSLFHSVSSFCNAGFDLLGNSLVERQRDTYLILVISALIISGGLGFIVWRDLLLYRQSRKLSLHTKLALSVTAALLVGGFLLFLVTEDVGKQLVTESSPVARVVNTFFMSVTPRTAGYASVDYLKMSNAGLILTMFLMYIGGTSGSTAGGLKTTTFGVLLVQMKSMFQGRSSAEIFHRTIRPFAVLRALTLFFLTLSLCVAAIMILSVTETIPTGNGIEVIAFEVFSAFGTVGVSMGLTPELTSIGKIVIICLMYIGRVGILTVTFSLLAKNNQTEPKYKYPEEHVLIG